MVAFKGHFDGRVIIPSDPISLPQGRELTFQVEPELRLVSGKNLLKYAGSLDQKTADEMTTAIQECERIENDGKYLLDTSVVVACPPYT